MNWPNAKNLTLAFLVILNSFLGILVFVNRTDYKLKPEAERAILKLLENNHITLDTVIPKDYTPMSQLMMTPCPADVYLKIFFPGRHDFRILLEYNKTIYKTDTETLTLQNGGAVFTATFEADEPERVFNEQMAVELCNTFLKSGEVNNFVLDRYTHTENRYTLEYRQFDKHLIFSNYFIFEVSPNGIINIRSKYDQSSGFENPRKDIISADRALYILMKYLVGEFENIEIIVNSIDIVYIQSETSANEDASLRSIPYYRFYYSENDLPLLVNAYTGVIFNYIY